MLNRAKGNRTNEVADMLHIHPVSVSQEKPKGAAHWSTRAVAQRVGLSHTKVHQILRKHGLKPHLVKRFQRNNGPKFTEKLEDIVGIYLDPHENAIILCIDEKSQIKALERTQPILPREKGSLSDRRTITGRMG